MYITHPVQSTCGNNRDVYPKVRVVTIEMYIKYQGCSRLSDFSVNRLSGFNHTTLYFTRGWPNCHWHLVLLLGRHPRKAPSTQVMS